jgi:hypothetical protein
MTSIIPKDHQLPGIPKQPGYIPVSGTLDYSNLTDEQIKEGVRYYAEFFCAGLRQLTKCCEAKEPTGLKNKQGQPMMKKCCASCELNIYYDKDPGRQAIHVANLAFFRSRMPKIDGLAAEIKNACPGLDARLQNLRGDGLPNLGVSNPTRCSILCGGK